MIDIWVLSNEAQVISFGSQADCWITIRIHSIEEGTKMLSDLVLQKNYFWLFLLYFNF